LVNKGLYKAVREVIYEYRDIAEIANKYSVENLSSCLRDEAMDPVEIPASEEFCLWEQWVLRISEGGI